MGTSYGSTEKSNGVIGNINVIDEFPEQSFCAPLCKCLQQFWILILNCIDFFAGTLITLYGIKLYFGHYTDHDIDYPIIGAGAILLLTSILSFVGTQSYACSCCLYPFSAFFGFAAALGELALAFYVYHWSKEYETWVVENKADLMLTTSDISMMKGNLKLVAAVAAILGALELTRCSMSSYYKGHIAIAAEREIYERQKSRYKKMLRNGGSI